jgi:hypothetical protein
MLELDYTAQGRRPSTRQITADWKKAGRPSQFQVMYGETFAEFERLPSGRWWAHGNGCRGVQRDAVVDALALQGV